MSDEPIVPGSLSTMGKIWEGIKHVGGKALKWAAIGAAVALGVAMLATVITPVGWVAGGIMALTGSTLSVATTLGLAGAAVGAVFGGLTGISGASEAINQAEDRSISNNQRAQMREFQVAQMQQQFADKQLGLAAKAQQIEAQALPGMGQGLGR